MGTVYNDIDKLKKKVQEKTQGEYEIIKYAGVEGSVEIKHTVCGEVSIKKVKTVTDRPTCKTCGYGGMKKRKVTTTTEEFKKYVHEVEGDNYLVLGEYVKAKTKIRMQHLSTQCSNHEYEVTPSDFKNNRRCPECARIRLAKSRVKEPNEFFMQFKELSNGDYTQLTSYKRWDKHITVRHNVCGYEYEVIPNSFLNGRRCPKCSTSHGEVFIEEVLNNLGLLYEGQKRFEGLIYKRQLSYDFYLPKHNILIEFNGKQHYSPIEFFGGQENFNKQVDRDNLKRDYAESKDIELVIFKYSDTQEDIVKVLTDISNRQLL